MFKWDGHWCAGWLSDKTISQSGSLNLNREAPIVPAEEAIYDLASLTKVVSTSSLLAHEYIRSGETWDLFLNRNLSDLVTELRGTAFGNLRLGEVWEHRSGLAAHVHFFDPPRQSGLSRPKAWSTVLQSILNLKLNPSREVVYSDVGFLLLGLYLERLRGERLDEQWATFKKTHGLSGLVLNFGVSEAQKKFLRPTESRHPFGELNDDNGFSLGGVAPHTGLFGTCLDLWHWLKALEQWIKDEPRVNSWLKLPPGPKRFHGGWDTPSSGTRQQPASVSQAGRNPHLGVLGHLGFTGTALWWHPATGRAGILLSNRVHPAHMAESQQLIRILRQEFFSSLWLNENLSEAKWVRVPAS